MIHHNDKSFLSYVPTISRSFIFLCSGGVQFYQKLSKTVFDLEEKSKNFFDGHGQELNQLMEKIKSTAGRLEIPTVM